MAPLRKCATRPAVALCQPPGVGGANRQVQDQNAVMVLMFHRVLGDTTIDRFHLYSRPRCPFKSEDPIDGMHAQRRRRCNDSHLDNSSGWRG